MRGGRTTIPEWELKQLRAITDAPTVAEREQALAAYRTERERRLRYARVRDAGDRQRRTLVGAHMPLEEAERVAHLADIAGMSVTAYVKRAIREAGRRTMAEAEARANRAETEHEKRLARGQDPASWAAAAVPRW